MNSPTIPPGDDEPRLPARLRSELALAEARPVEEPLDQSALRQTPAWRILWERKFLILGLAALGLVLALGYALVQTPLYRSAAMIELDPNAGPSVNVTAGESQGSAFQEPDDEFLETQYGLLKSKTLALDVIGDLGLADGAGEAEADALASRMIDHIGVDPVRSSRLVELSYLDEDAEQSTLIVNALANAFVTAALVRRYEAAASARTFLETRLAEVRVDLDEAERNLVDYAQANGIVPTGGSDGDSLEGASLVALNSALAAAQQRKIAAEQRYRNMSGSGSAAEVSQRTAELRAELARLQAEYSDKSTFLQDEYPEMVRLLSRIESIQQRGNLAVRISCRGRGRARAARPGPAIDQFGHEPA